MEYAIETFSLTKIFSDWWGRNKVYAVEELNLKIEYNQVFGLLGPNGSGKTTTIKMLLGLLYPTSGRSLMLGGDSTATAISSRIGFMPEESYLYKYLDARETLEFYGSLFKIPSKVLKMRIEALLDMVGLSAVANRPVGTYSKGMARRIGLAQALINDPELLILDEPTTGLDPIGTKQIKNLIMQLSKRGKTILLCSHLLADVEDVCDKIAILYGGKIQEEGRVRELLMQSDKRQITTGAVSEAALHKIENILRQENLDFDVDSPMEKLETFFIKTVARAQQADIKTSGAVSKTGISDFLKSAAPSENLLDKLVSANVASETHIAEKTAAESESAAKEIKRDDRLLKELTEASQSVNVETKEVTPLPVSQVEEVNIDVLNQLTGNAETKETSKGKKHGDSGNA